MKTVLTLAATLLLATSLQAQSESMPPHQMPMHMAMPSTIVVSGSGRAVVDPDRFTFSVGVQTLADTVDAAVAENNRRVAAVIAALRKAGAGEKDIQTANFNIYPQQQYVEGKLPRILGYQVSNNINVRSSKIADAGRLLGIAINAGVNTSSGLNFEVSDPAKGRDAGLRAAFDDARAKASLLAQAAGRTLGPALAITEGGGSMPTPPPMPMRAMAMEAKVGDVPVEAGSQELSYSVSVTFEMH